MSAAVGADIESLCSKCGDVWHVVVAKVGEEVVKVQCKQCGGYHRHRSPNGAASSAKKSEPRPRVARTPRPVVERFETPQVAADLSKPSRTYSPRDKFAIGDRVEHPSFGSGVVEATPEPGKMTVFFAAGRKVLVHEKGDAGAGALARPRPFDHSKNLGLGDSPTHVSRPAAGESSSDEVADDGGDEASFDQNA
jgi:hypothetical protein